MDTLKYQAAAANFYWTVSLSLLSAVAVALIAHAGMPPTLRLSLTIFFFFSILLFFWCFTTPLSDLLSARFAVQYFDCGAALERSWKLYVHSVSNVIAALAWVLIVWVVCIMLRVLALWPIFSVLGSLQPLLTYSVWVTTLAIPLCLFFKRSDFGRALQAGRQLREQAATSGFEPATASLSGAREVARESVEFTAPCAFWAGNFDWEWDDFYKSAIVFGQPGSGKTACVLNALLDGLIGSSAPGLYPYPAAGLILDPKGDYRNKIHSLMQQHGRAKDLLVIDADDPANSMHWNPLDTDENELELANSFVRVLGVLGMKNESDTFWVDAAKTFFRHALALLRSVSPSGVPANLFDINNLASNPNQIRGLVLYAAIIRLQEMLGREQAGWLGVRDMLEEVDNLYEAANQLPKDDSDAHELRAFFFQFFDGEPADRQPYFEAAWRRMEAHQVMHGLKVELPRQVGRVEDALNYMRETWISMAEETRSGIQVNLTNMLDPFLMEPYRQLFNGRSTTRVTSALDEGKVIYVSMPIAKAETMSKIVSTFIKDEFYREVLKRPDKDRPSFYFCDEFQSYFTVGDGKGDADFFERSRQSRHANVIATQNLEALYKVSDKEPPVHNLLANCALKFFLRNTDKRTNEYASKLFGEKLEALTGSNRSTNEDGWRRRASRSSGYNEQVQYGQAVREEVFTALTQPSKPDGISYTETIVHFGSRATVQKLRLRWPLHLLK